MIQQLTPSSITSSLDKKQSICSSANDCYNAKQASSVIGISDPTFSNWKKKGQIQPDHQHGKRDYYTHELIMTYQAAYQTSKSPPNKIEAEDPVGKLSGDCLFQSEIIQTSADDNSNELQPFKAEAKILNSLIEGSTHKPNVLFLFLGMLITIIIKILILIKAEPNMVITAYELQEQYLQSLNDQSIIFSPQGLPLEDSTSLLMNGSGKKEIAQGQTDLSDENDNQVATGSSKISIWQNAVASANQAFLTISRLTNDDRLDEEERERAKYLKNKTLEPYQRLTSYIDKYEPGTARHDVPLLILTKKPKDFDINSHRWSINALTFACSILKTKKASRATVGRIVQDLDWNFAIKPKLMSSDPEYGAIMLHMGLVFNQLSSDDMVIFSDEFKYTSSKVAEYLKEKTLPSGMNTVPPFAIHRPYYRTKAAIQLTGLLCGKSRELLLKELEDGTFDGYYKTLTALLDELIAGKGNKGKIYLVIDNAPNHQPNVLRHQLLKKYKGSIEVLALPKYAPHHNLIERTLKLLLETSERCGNTEEELWTYLEDAKQRYDDNRVERELKLHCEVCGKKWVFNKENRKSNEFSLKKHICFRIEGLNPYIIYVLTHSLETLKEVDDSMSRSTN